MHYRVIVTEMDSLFEVVWFDAVFKLSLRALF